MSTIFVGPFIHIDNKGELIIVEHAAILVKNGKITNVIIDPQPNDIMADNIIYLKDGQFLIPGFIDCHIHAPQYPNLGLGYDKLLLEWLDSYTFPLEKKYEDEAFANQVFKEIVKHTIYMGTTTACYFASLYTKASVILAQNVTEIGQRAFIGKINMNIPHYENYYENTKESIVNTNQFIQDILKINNPLLKPIITPRFALSCDMELMTELGKLAKQKDLHIQTHISENLGEVEAVKNTFKEYPSYAAVYDAAGLLTNKTILAHGIYLTDNELELLKERGSAVIHCPSSNTCLKSGLCDVQRLTDKEITVGLGTDVAGGQSCSILDAMKSALQVSKHLSMIKDNYQPLTYKDVFYMATLGGAKALSIHNEIGNLVPGKEFDALVIDITTGLLQNLMEYTLEEKFQRFIYSGDDRSIVEVYVSGRKVK